jgi:hypothetical protein
MGVDGRQTLYICGPELIIQKIERLRGRITDCSEPTITATFEKEILDISVIDQIDILYFPTNIEIFLFINILRNYLRHFHPVG